MQTSVPGFTDRNEWLTEFFGFYRGLGFLQAYAARAAADFVPAVEDLDPEQLPELADIVDDIDNPGDLFSPYDVPTFHMSPADNLVIDLRLLALFDPRRVWWRRRDLEALPEPRPDYLATFSRWLSTAEGRVSVENLRWHPGTRPALSFRLAGVDHKVQATYTTVDYGLVGDGPVQLPDPGCLREVNRLIQPQGPRFQSYERLIKHSGKVNLLFDATAYVLFLEPQQRDAIWQSRHWSIW